MKNILIIFFLFLCYNVVAQNNPSGVPTQFSTGWFRHGWDQSDSGKIFTNRAPNFTPRFAGTVEFYQDAGIDSLLHLWTGARWLKLIPGFDSTSMSNRINLKLNITDTTLKWWGIGKRWVDTVYRVNDSTVGFTINGGAQQTFEIKGGASGGGGGSGTVTSVALSMPSAFSVTGSPITTNGTFNVSGAGTSAQYIRGNGTLATTDTSMIPDFHLKVRSLITGTSPITFNQTTGIIGINNANTSGTKGAASFNSASFSDNGSGLISLNQPVPPGSCINCDITWGPDGRPTSYASGTPPQFVNAPGAGDTLSILDTLKRLNNGYGILHVVTANNITHSVDTSAIATQYDLTQTANISNTSLTANGNYSQNWSNKQWYVDSIATQFLFRMGGVGSTGTRRKEFRINWGGSSFGDNLDGYNMMAVVKKADNSADSLRLGLISSGLGTLSMGAYDVANPVNNTFISYAITSGLLNISAKDSIWIKGASPATSADSVLGLIHRSGGVSKLVKIPLSSATTLNNIGAGRRLVATPSGDIKTVFGDNTLTVDSTSNANALTFKVDTSVIATQYDLTRIIDTSLNIYRDTVFVPLLVMEGESNAAGFGTNTYTSAGELDADPKVQIMQPSGVFETLNISSGNNLPGGAGEHGFELELQHQIVSRFGNRTVYVVKAGVPGTSISQWLPGTPNYDTLVIRLTNAINKIGILGKVPAICYWHSQGINDVVGGTSPDTWINNTMSFFVSLRNRFGFFPIIMTHLVGDRTTFPNFNVYDRKIDSISSIRNNYIYNVPTPQGPVGSSSTDSVASGGIHWEYLGLKAITDRFVKNMIDSSGYYYYYRGIRNLDNNSWNIFGNRNIDSTLNFLGTIDAKPFHIKTNSLPVITITSDQKVGVGISNPAKLLDVNGDIQVNGQLIGRSSGNVISNHAIGVDVLVNNTTGNNNIGFGYNALNANSTGNFNTAIGTQALSQNSTNCCNVAIGFQAGVNSTGPGNVFLGTQAGGTGNYSNKFFLSNLGSVNLLYGDFSNGHLVVNPGSTPSDDGVGTAQIHGKLTVYTHDIATNSDSAIVWNRTTKAYELAKINTSSVTTLYTGDGTLSGNRTVSGGGFTLNLGTGGNVLSSLNITSSGRTGIFSGITYDVDANNTDADYTVATNTIIAELTDVLTAGRTLTLPTASVNGQSITLLMRFSSGTNKYSLSAAVTDNATGATFTTLDWGKTYDFMVDQGLTWRLIRKY